MNSQPSIWRYADYRTFLAAYGQYARRKNPHWTFGTWSFRLGLKDTSSVTKIIAGQRNPSEQLTERLVSYFSFSEREAGYFRDLVRLHKTKGDPKVRQTLLERLRRRNHHVSMHVIDDRVFSAISNWYCLAVRELAKLKGFRTDPGGIAKRFIFKVTPSQVKQALETLLALELLERRPNGTLAASSKQVHTTNDIPSEAIKTYHEQMLEIAKTAVRNLDVDQREFTSTNFVMMPEDVPRAKDLIRKFKADFEALLTPGMPSGEVPQDAEVFQLQMQFFPLTERKISREKK